MEALKELPQKINSYKNGELSFDKLVTFIKNNFRPYTVWKDHPITQTYHDNSFRNFILILLSKMQEPLVEENEQFLYVLVKKDAKTGILVSYNIERIYIVEAPLIETFNFTEKINENNVQPHWNQNW